MHSAKITAKRRATFPLETCEGMQIGPSDIVDVEPRMIDSERVWVFRPKPILDRSWIGALKGPIQSGDHSMQGIRHSIAVGR